MSANKTPDGIVIKKFDPSQTEEVVAFLMEDFRRDEPLMQSFHTEASPGFEKFFTDVLALGASFVAIDTEADNKVVGARLNKITKKDDPREEGTDVILKLVHDAFDQVDVFNKYNIDAILEGKSLSVHKDYRGKGIAGRMMEATLDFMRENKVPLCYIPCTSALTVKVLKKLDFETVLEIPYDTYLVDGKRVFFPKEPHKAFTICVKLV